MIKSLRRYNIQLTPFEAAKNWALNNVDNDDLLLFESSASNDGEPLDLEFIDYGDGIITPFTSSECEIALEQQTDDRVDFREGLNIVGSFYPDTDPVNVDGTYKRTVYCQVRTTFYNDYRNVTQLWGVENIDFENSKTKRRLTDKLRMYDIPRLVYGDKIVPNSVKIYDTSLDNDYIIADDGNGNLFAEENLFSKQQEIGDFVNEFEVGMNLDCCVYFGNCPSGSVTTTTTTTTTTPTTTTTTTTPTTTTTTTTPTTTTTTTTPTPPTTTTTTTTPTPPTTTTTTPTTTTTTTTPTPPTTTTTTTPLPPTTTTTTTPTTTTTTTTPTTTTTTTTTPTTTTTTTTPTTTTTTTTTTTPAPLCDCSEWSAVDYECFCGEVGHSMVSQRSVCLAIGTLPAGSGEIGPYLECWCTHENLDDIIAYVSACYPERIFSKHVYPPDVDGCVFIGIVRTV